MIVVVKGAMYLQLIIIIIITVLLRVCISRFIEMSICTSSASEFLSRLKASFSLASPSQGVTSDYLVHYGCVQR